MTAVQHAALPSEVEVLSAYEEQIAQNRLRNQKFLESLGVRKCRAILGGRSSPVENTDQFANETKNMDARARGSRRGRKKQAVAAATVQTRSQRRMHTEHEGTSTQTAETRDHHGLGVGSFVGVELLAVRPSEKSPPSLGRYAFWEPVTDPHVSLETKLKEELTAVKVPLTPEKVTSLPVTSKKRIILKGAGELDSSALKETAKERRIRKRKALESRFCADLPREPAPYALQCVQERRKITACCSTVVAPFTLLSIGVTVQKLGQLVIRPDNPLTERKWFSSRLAMYAHPFPEGYHATKMHWNRLWHMHIEMDPNGGGPMFIVRSDDGKETYRRHTPSHAWMDACLNSHAPGTRISGPLFYGFSDPWLQYVIQSHLVADAQDRLKANGIQFQGAFALGMVRQC